MNLQCHTVKESQFPIARRIEIVFFSNHIFINFDTNKRKTHIRNTDHSKINYSMFFKINYSNLKLIGYRMGTLTNATNISD